MLRRIGCLMSRGLRPERGGGRPGWRAEGVPLKPWGKLSQTPSATSVLSCLMLYTLAPLDA